MHDINFDLAILTRILAAVILGFGLGLEREITNKYAGLRTHILVCLGSCVFTILSIYAFPMAVDQSHPQAYGDPARIAAQVLTGIGFIGGGTVLRHGSSVSGLTTAATLWVAAAIGMACGAGMFNIAFVATVFSVSVLVLIRLFEKNVLVYSTKNLKHIRVIATCRNEDAENIHSYIMENFDYIHEVSRKHEEHNEQLTRIIAIFDINGKKPVQSLYKKFQGLKGLESISIQESND
ncbi:MAG: MgtC/SapB family protein [Candidatus Gastranaerophilales bacterium]|nr:MgtC/SapB family protein [Candidatus Gastranaerophilales bacterium]